MRDFLYIGSTPSDETCFPAGHAQARAEVCLYRKQLEHEFPDGQFRIKSCPHDFGTYYEVVAYFDDEDDKQTTAAYNAECASSPLWLPEFAKEAARLRTL